MSAGGMLVKFAVSDLRRSGAAGKMDAGKDRYEFAGLSRPQCTVSESDIRATIGGDDYGLIPRPGGIVLVFTAGCARYSELT